MKKGNLIILGAFILVIIVFSLFSCDEQKSNEEIIIDEQTIPLEEGVEKPKKYVDIILSGQLERTGNYNVPSHWSLRMLFDYAGVKEDGDISLYVLSDKVEDGKVYDVPKLEDEIKVEDGKVNINTASIDELTTIPGIGETLAQRIIAYRKETPFTTILDIKNISGIGENVYEKIKDYITV